MPFTRFERLKIPDVTLIEPRVFGDQRGYFKETYKQSDFVVNGIPQNFPQDNISRSTRGVIRGLHYQRHPKPMGKLVTVYLGTIFDVAVDLRKASPTFGKWVGVTLSDENHRLLYVPEGFAHGFACLSEEALVAYKVTNEFDPDLDSGFRWNDPDIGVDWPLKDPILSTKDQSLPLFKDGDHNFYN
jgi:dTDP-4-dehydrorhamnose 3,5-epimerase